MFSKCRYIYADLRKADILKMDKSRRNYLIPEMEKWNSENKKLREASEMLDVEEKRISQNLSVIIK